MNLVYLSEALIPSRATNAMQIMRMCAAFQASGNVVTLVHPRHDGPLPEGYNDDLWAFYGVQTRFARVTLATLSAKQMRRLGRLSRLARLIPLLAFVSWRSQPRQPPFVCYSRSILGAWVSKWVRRRLGRRSACQGVFLELHDIPSSSRMWRLLAETDGLVVISDALRERIMQDCPVLATRMWVEHDGVDLQAIRPDRLEREDARGLLGLTGDSGPVVVYTGRAIAGKGVDVLLKAAPALRRIRARVIIVGRVYEREYVDMARALPHVTFTGFMPPVEIPKYLAAADVLVMPTSPTLAYAAYTSPLKLFEYMASGRPVIASDLPVLREVLTSGYNALLFRPDDAGELAVAVERLWSEPSLRERIAAQAWQDVQYYSWENRARRIVDHIHARCGDPLT